MTDLATAAPEQPAEAPDNARVRGWATRTWQSYRSGEDRAGDQRPLPGYAVLMSMYGSGCLTLAAAAAARVRRRGPLERPTPLDLGLSALAVFRLTRTLSKDAVTSPLRAPFLTYQGPAGPGEVMEAPRPGPVRHAVGELVSCPFCLSQWVATATLAGHLLAPRTTRWVTAGLSVVAVADLLQ